MFSLQRGSVLAAASIFLCVTLAACAVQSAVPGRIAPAIPARAADVATHLYVWNEQIPPAELDEFGTAGGRPSLRIPGPKGLGFGRTAVDSTGTVYIVGGSPYAPRLSEYRAGSTKPFQSITKGIGNVLGLDADSNDRLYVLDFGGPLVEYAAGATTPSAATYSGLCVNSSNAGPEALTVDRSGNVYVLATCGRPGQHSHAIFHSTTAD